MIPREVGTAILLRLPGTCSDPKQMLAMSGPRRLNSLWVRWSVRGPSARTPSYENARQNPYRALSVLDLVRHCRSHFSGPIQSNESRVMGIPERPLLPHTDENRPSSYCRLS